MAGVNKVIILGRLGKDPETKTFENGGKICTITMATSESYTDREGNKVEKTEWHNIIFTNKLAELAEKYLGKGKELYVEGKLRTRKYDDSNGVTRYVTEIVATNMNFIGGQNDSSTSQSDTSQSATIQDDGGLPF
jgi:single-strand DNA-binding protein